MDITPLPFPARLRQTGLVLVTLGVLLAGCGGDADPTADAADTAETQDTTDGDVSADGGDAGSDEAGPPDESTDTGTDTDGADDLDAETAEGPSQVLVQFRGEQIVVTGDDDFFSCLTMGGTDTVAFGILDDVGHDISANVTGDSVSATATLADGTNWNQTEDGVLNVVEAPDGAVRMSIQMTETDTGESEPMDVRLTC